MSKCYYELKGHRFNSEIELDDFLATNWKHLKQYGDVVFSRTASQNNIHDIIARNNKRSEELKKKWYSASTVYIEDEAVKQFNKPYIGVNEFISGRVNSEGKRWTPEFIVENYWNNRFEKWSEVNPGDPDGIYTDDEITVLFDGDRSKAVAITDKDIQNKKKDEITKKWKIQSEIGNTIHEILYHYFRYNTDHFKIHGETMDKDSFKADIEPRMHNKEYFNDKVFEDAYKICTQIKKSFPEGSLFYPENLVTTTLSTSLENGADQLLGVIDLIVVDPEGHTHVIDYKTSPKSLEKYSTAKRRAYQYQTAIYRRILEKYGINMDNKCKVQVLPIIIDGLDKEGNYDGCHVEMLSEDNMMWEDISQLQQFGVLNDYVESNIEPYLPKPTVTNITFDKVYDNVTKQMSLWFSNFISKRTKTREQVIDELKRGGYLEKTEDDEFVYKPKGSSMKAITAKTESEFVDKVVQFKEQLSRNNINTVHALKTAFKEAMDEGSQELNFRLASKLIDEHSNANWLNEKLAPYLNGNWEVLEDTIVEQFGMILLKNHVTGVIDVLKVSSETDLRYIHNLSTSGKSNLLTGGLTQSDLSEKSKFQSLMLQSASGNIEMIEAMLVLNSSINLFGEAGKIGKIQVVNPSVAKGLSASNEELYYSFKQLNSINKELSVKDNLFETKEIQFQSRYSQVCDTIKDIMTRIPDFTLIEQRKWKPVESCMSAIESVADQDVQGQLKALNDLRKVMENNVDANWTFSKVQEDLAHNNKDHVYLYNQVLSAMAFLRGIDVRQQLRDVEEYFEGNLLTFQGSHLDNPGMLSSKPLNQLTTLITEAYQNLRSVMQEPLAKQRKLIEALKSEKGFGYLKEISYGNQIDLYSNMLDKKNGDIFLKNPYKDGTLTTAESEYLKFFLETINKNRFANRSQAEIDKMILDDSDEYFRIPLSRASSASVTSQKGLMKGFADKLKGYYPPEIYKRFKEEAIGLFDDSTKSQTKTELFEMSNRFNKGESSERADYIEALGGTDFIDVDLETLLLKHTYAYKQKQIIDEIFPYIKAITIGINNQSLDQDQEFTNSLQYIKDYIQAVIKNESITDHKKAEAYLSKTRSTVSTLVLGFNPAQFYQYLQGLWNDIKLIIADPSITADGKKVFTVANMRKASIITFRDIFKSSNTVTVSSALNELYGLNDMDSNSYAQNVSTNKNGLFNIKRLAFKFASRPDYYNRLIIFHTQMIADGCEDAHSIQDGKLVYDWTKDDRFSKFAANPTSNDPEVAKQRGLYIAMCKQFEREHTKLPDGSEFKFKQEYINKPIALPRAYTTQQAEGYKALADQIYGYYSHEKKSLIHFTLLGSMFMQFKTFWSGKKNQYLQEGGVKLQGKMVHYQENGQPLYYKVSESGDILWDEMTTENTGVAVYQWEGQWQEGIARTIYDLFRQVHNGESFIDAWNDKWNNADEKMRRVYQSNFKALLYDLLAIAIGGLLFGTILKRFLKEQKEDVDSDDTLGQLDLSCQNIGARIFTQSFTDFNFIDSIGSPLINWSPMTFEYGIRLAKQIWNIAFGDAEVWNVAINSSTALKSVKPVLDTFKPSIFGE